MTPQEQEKLQHFLTQLGQAQGVQRDPDADAVINAAVSRQPDAAYLLVQRTLLQDQALEAARARIDELERQTQTQAARPASSFLGGADDWGNSARAASSANMPAAAASSYSQSPGNQAGAQVPDAPQRPGMLSRFGMAGGGAGGGGGSFLGTMAATAAGVAGGAFLFQGLGSLMGGHGGADAAKQGLASDTTGDSAAASGENSLAKDAGVSDVGTAPSQEQGVMDDTASLDDAGGMDDFGGGDDFAV